LRSLFQGRVRLDYRPLEYDYGGRQMTNSKIENLFLFIAAARHVLQKYGTRADGIPKNWTEWRDLDDAIDAVEAELNAPQNGEILGLLEEAYVFIAVGHKRHRPWRAALDKWQAKVEKVTGWTPARIKDYAASRIEQEGDE
jgi:hypothetical protein